MFPLRLTKQGLILLNLIRCYEIVLISGKINFQVPINPYGKAKKMAEDIILDFSKNSDMAVMILRLVVSLHLCY